MLVVQEEEDIPPSRASSNSQCAVGRGKKITKQTIHCREGRAHFAIFSTRPLDSERWWYEWWPGPGIGIGAGKGTT